MKYHLSILDWRNDGEELWGTIADFDLVVLTLRLLSYRVILEWSFQPISNWIWRWQVKVLKPRSINQLLKVYHELPSLDFTLIVYKVKT